MKKTFGIALAMLIIPVVLGFRNVNFAEANPGPARSVPPVVSLSNAQVHASISYVNNELWAKVDASYHMSTDYAFGDTFLTENYKMGLIADPSPYVTVTVTYDKLEAYYPFPSDAANISVKVDGIDVELVSRNRSFHLYGDVNLPELTWMITPVPRNFTITVHYEQPLHKLSGTNPGEYTFLYSLGARFGLDDLIYGYYGYYWFIDSTAQFDLLVEPSFNEVNARLIEQQTPLDSTLSSEPLKCIFSTENGMTRVEFNVSAPASTLTYSGAALLTEEVPEISEISPLMPVLIAVGAASVAIVAVVATQVYWKKRKR